MLIVSRDEEELEKSSFGERRKRRVWEPGWNVHC